jgi:hypothetical protein
MKSKKQYLKNKDGFYENYTTEDCLRSGQELKESGTCHMINPEFYGLWNWDDPNKVEDEETKILNRERRLKVRELVKELNNKKNKKKYNGGTQ